MGLDSGLLSPNSVLSTVDSTPSLHSHSGHESPAMPSAQGAAAFPSFLISVFYVLTALHSSLCPDLAQMNNAFFVLFWFGLNPLGNLL